MILLTATQTLEIVLAANITTSQLTYTTHYIDEVLSTFQLGAVGASDGLSNNTTAVAIVGAPTTGRVRKVSGLSLYNGDTVASIVSIQVNDNGTTRIIWKGLLIDGDTLIYTDLRGFGIINSSGEWRVAVSNLGSSAASSSTSVAAHAPSHEAGGTDPVPLDTLAAPSDTTTLNVSSTKHGLSPKSPADATQFLNGAATPAYAQVKDSDLSTSDVTTNNATSLKHGFLKKLSGTASEVLRGDGTFGAVNPGLTAGSVIYAGASGTSLAEDNANLFYDGTNHRLGLGLTSPARILDIQGVASADSAMIRSGTTSTFYREFGRNNSTGAFDVRRAQGGAAVADLSIDTSGNTTLSGNTKWNTSQVFSWNAKTVTTAYQAASDGFVVAVCDASGGGARVGQIIGYTDASNPPTTVRGGTVGSSGGPSQGSFMMPVRSGDYYMTTATDLVSTCSYTMYWVPMGTAG